MQQADVTAQPLDLQFTFLPYLLAENFTDNAQYGAPPTFDFTELEPFIAGLSDQLSVLETVLSQPLGKVFDAAWKQAKPSVIPAVIHAVKVRAKDAGHPISNVKVTAPDSGSVFATVETATDVAERVPALAGRGIAALSLDYTLPGWAITFDALGPGENWIDTFDVTLRLSTLVPDLPFGFAPTVTISVSNAQFGPNDWEASFVAGVDRFFTWLGNAIIDGTFESDYDYVKQAIEDATNQPQSLTVQNPLTATLTQLNSVGPQVVAAGFNQFDIAIDNGDQLVATLTHPLDPGPVLQNAATTTFHLRKLSTSDSVVAPGGTLTVVGTDFPVDATQLDLQWTNSASGTILNDLSAELVITPTGGAPQLVPVPLDTSQFPPGYGDAPTGLAPNNEYTFTARCRDTAAWSLWSDPLTLTTGLSDDVTLMLLGQPGSGFLPQQLGGASIAITTGDWSTQVTIPAATPPGDYTLAAEQNGQTVAGVALVVGAVSAHLDIIDPANGQVISDPVVPFETPFTVHGAAFPDNALVTFTISGQPVGSPVSAINGQFQETLTSPPVQTPSAYLTVTATAAGVSASETYEQVGVLL